MKCTREMYKGNETPEEEEEEVPGYWSSPV